jgi:hypothetical protein
LTELKMGEAVAVLVYSDAQVDLGRIRIAMKASSSTKIGSGGAATSLSNIRISS